MQELDQELLELYKEINRKEKIQIHLKHLQEVIEKNTLALDSTLKQLNQQESDLAQLDGLNIHSVFSFILGTKQEQLEKTRQEYLQSFLKHRGLEDNLKSLHEEQALLEQKYSGLHAIDKEFDELADKKIHLLKKLRTYPKKLKESSKKIARYDAKINELKSVIKHGLLAKQHLHKIIIGLDKVDRWGKGNTSPHGKGNRNAKTVNKDIYTANNHLQKYEDKLYGYSNHFGINYKKEVDELEHFLDQFIDCLITDWIVKKKIENSSNLVLNIMDKITLIIDMFEYEIEKTKSYLEEEEDRKDALLITFIQKNKSS